MKEFKKIGVLFIIVFVFFIFFEPKIGVLLLGLIAFIASIYGWITHQNIKKNGIQAIGKIVSYKEDNDGNVTPMIAFKTEKGELIQNTPFFHLSSSFSGIQFGVAQIGEACTIRYNPKKPRDFTVEGAENILTILIFFIIGLAIITIFILDILEVISFNF